MRWLKRQAVETHDWTEDELSEQSVYEEENEIDRVADLAKTPEGLEAIASNPWEALVYATKVLHGPFPQGEAAIATESGYAFAYAIHILKRGWPEAGISDDDVKNVHIQE